MRLTTILYFLPSYVLASGTLCSNIGTCAESKDTTIVDTYQIVNHLSVGPTIKLVQRSRKEIHARVSSEAQTIQDTLDIYGSSKISHISHVSKSIIPPVPPNTPLSAGIFQDGNDFSYFAEVYLGSEKSKMYMLLDTGASLSWVMGEDCTNPICKSRNTFGAQNSSTFEASDVKFSINYGSGSCSGTMAQDTISFAGLSFKMPLGIASEVSREFGSFEMYGILGLAMTGSNPSNFLNSVIASKTLKSNLFGISLSRDKDGNNTGVINFGTPDTSRLSGEIKYYPLVGDNGAWEIELASAGFGSAQFPIAQKVLLDTGTSYIFAPLELSIKMHELIVGAKTMNGGANWHVPCGTTVDMVFKLGSDLYTIPSTMWIGPPTSDGLCLSTLCGTDLNDGFWVLGDIFLKNYYTIFDIDNRRIGIANVHIPTLSSISSSSSARGENSSSQVNPAMITLNSTSSTSTPEKTPKISDRAGSSGRRSSIGLLPLSIALTMSFELIFC
ncbi:Aspartic-type endopeptidase ctsD [Golovinomyces cichoracearum]|uniref:Aspartic-type endopeptidase ctsD n=1 Tax=Golovinomyces cichoracearum TaxID=62708 RepID=A0A420J4G5_9PEZI|nr:Aspartic-type endopeptidase ctsD [Golovinomyces cichoracearum]